MVWLKGPPPEFYKEPEPEEATTGEVFQAAFENDTIVGSAMSRPANMPDTRKTTDFNAYQNLTEDEKLDEAFATEAVYADNLKELEALRIQQSREKANRKTLAEAGFSGFVIGTGAQLLDPINYIPVGGGLMAAYRNGGNILKGAATVGASTAGIVTAQEAALQGQQMERTFGESVTNVAAAGFLGSILGIPAARAARDYSQAVDEIKYVMDAESRVAGGTSALSPKDAGAAANLNLGGGEIKGNIVRAMAKKMRFDPLTRTVSSDAESTRQAVNRLADNVFEIEGGNIESVESRIKSWQSNYFRAATAHKDAYIEYNKRETSSLGSKMQRLVMGHRKFDEAVGRAVAHGSDDPIIEKAASAWRQQFYEPLKQAGVDAKMFDPAETTTSKYYRNRVWKTEAIAANLPDFITRTSTWLKGENQKKIALQQEVADLADQYEALATNTKLSLDEIKQQQQEIVAKLESSVIDMPSSIKNEVVSQFKQRGKEATKMTKGLGKAVNKIINRDYEEMTDVDFERLAEEIAQRITKTPDGMLPYDFKLGDRVNADGVVENKFSSPFQKRTFMIPDELMSDFLEDDIQVLAQLQLGRMAPDIELYKEFGDVDMKAELKNIQDEYTARQKAAKTENERTALEKRKNNDIRDIAAMRDRLRNRYGMVDPDSYVDRIFRTARDLNYMRLLGGVVAASIPDAGRAIAAGGFLNVFGKSMAGTLANLNKTKPLVEEIRNYAIGLDDLINGRAQVIADISDYTRGGTKFERGVRAASGQFSNINLMNQWTKGIKTVTAIAIQNRLIKDLGKGKLPKDLVRLGIDEANAKNIAGELRKHSRKVEGGSVMANTQAWDSPELARMWGNAIRKEIDRVIVTPGQEKPLFMSTQFGSTMFQFRSFMMSATTRVLMAGLQGQDARMMQGIAGMITLGAMSYVFKEWDAGRDVDLSPDTLIIEGIDRSGVLGIFMEANNTIEKVSGNNIGLRGLLNTVPPASRFASRSALDSMVGPTFGLAGDMTKLLSGATGEGEWLESDTRAMRRLIPGQNLSLVRQGFDKLEQAVGE